MDDQGFGIAQGGMVDTPEGDWYAFLFQDWGALGRAPVITPMTFDREGFPVLATADGRIRLAPFWQFSHNPDPEGWSVTRRPGALRLIPQNISPNPTTPLRIPFCVAFSGFRCCQAKRKPSKFPLRPKRLL